METFKIILLTAAVCGQVTLQQTEVQIGKPSISPEPSYKVLYRSETVTLHCQVSGASELQYDWYKDSADLAQHEPSIRVTDSGKYQCKAKKGASESERSDAYTLTLQDPPQPKLSIESEWKSFYSTEKVTLKCSIDGGSDEWGYEWFNNGKMISAIGDFSSSGNTLSISSAKATQSGRYQCKGKHLKRTAVTTGLSEEQELKINDETPTPNIIKHQWFDFFYTEEKIQLDCEMSGEGWKYTWNKNSVFKSSSPGLTISSASLSDAGEYQCRVKRGDFTVDSEKLQVQVEDPPQPKLSIESEWKSFYPTEKVTLKCSIVGGSDEWGYEWSRNGEVISAVRDFSSSGNTLSISSAKATQSGRYKCKGKHLKRTAVTTGFSEEQELKINDKTPTPNIIKHQWFDFFYTKEKIQLDCKMSGEGWKYTWNKNSDSKSTSPDLTISSASISDAGEYQCRVKRGDFTVDSEKLQVQVQDPPQPKLSIESEWKSFYSTEKVTLKCSIIGGSDEWGYEWSRNGEMISAVGDFSSSGNTLSISSAKATQSGRYQCKGKHLKRTAVTTGLSEEQELKINDKTPTPNIIKHQWFDFFYTKEKIQLDCKMSGEGWKYTWNKNSDSKSTSPDLTISSASLSDAGEYQCRVKRGDFTVDSEKLQVQVQDPPQPKLSIESEWKSFYSTEKVTLKCSIVGGSDEWGYEWSRNGEVISAVRDFSSSGNTLSISSAKATQSGRYQCKGKHLKRTAVTTGLSEEQELKINDKTPTPNIIKHQWFDFFYTEEKIQLNCKMSGEGWKYTWNKNSVSKSTSPDLTISSASLSDAGEYQCRVKRGDFTVDSEKLQVQVQDPPQPKLSIESEWKSFYSTEKVTLKCSIVGGSDEWGYEWSRNGEVISAVRDFSSSGNTLSISSAKATQSGLYKCKGKHLKRTAVTTELSEEQELKINDETPTPNIIKHQWFDFFYTEEKIQLNCEMSGEGWKYTWNKNSVSKSSSPGLTISSASLSDAGEYQCRVKRGDFTVDSEKLQLQVQAFPDAKLTLETELNDIVLGDMTFKCNISDSREWNYTWYKNGDVYNGSSERLKVKGDDDAIKSEFKCKGKRTERPLFSNLSEGLVANHLILKRKILLAISGCLVCCIVILFIGCIVLKMTRKTEKKEIVQEDLFFSMADSMNQTTSPLKEYMDNRPTEMEVCKEKEELVTDRSSVLHEDGVIKGEDPSATEANGLTSFKGL